MNQRTALKIASGGNSWREEFKRQGYHDLYHVCVCGRAHGMPMHLCIHVAHLMKNTLNKNFVPTSIILVHLTCISKVLSVYM